ncbi:unnamed protein product, partial [Heligmosomoides polygyrus]
MAIRRSQMMSILKEILDDQRKQVEAQLQEQRVQQCDRVVPEETPSVMAALCNRIEKFVFDADKEMAFSRWYARYKAFFTLEAEQLSEATRVGLLCEKLDVVTFEKYQRHALPKNVSDIGYDETVETLKKLFDFKASEFTTKYQCLKLEKNAAEDYLTYTGRVNEFCERAKLHDLDSDGIKCLLWIFGLKSQSEAEIRQRLISVLDREYKAGRKISLHQLHQECENFLSLKRDCETIAGSDKVVEAKKPWFCKKCKISSHREKFCDVASQKKTTERAKNSHKNFRHSDKRNHIKVEFLLDTGSDITLLNQNLWKKMGSPKLEKTNVIVKNASGDVMQIEGRLKCTIEMKGKNSEGYAYVTPYNSLMGLEWLQNN